MEQQQHHSAADGGGGGGAGAAAAVVVCADEQEVVIVAVVVAVAVVVVVVVAAAAAAVVSSGSSRRSSRLRGFISHGHWKFACRRLVQQRPNVEARSCRHETTSLNPRLHFVRLRPNPLLFLYPKVCQSLLQPVPN